MIFVKNITRPEFWEQKMRKSQQNQIYDKNTPWQQNICQFHNFARKQYKNTQYV